MENNHKDIVFRLADQEDAVEIERIEAQSLPVPWSLCAIVDEIQRSFSGYFLACSNEKILGYMGYEKMFEQVSIHNIAVKEKFRGIGIGTYMMKNFLTFMAEKGGESFFIEVRASNEVAKKLYESAGFRLISVRKSYYTDPVEDGEVMCLELEKI